MYETQEGTYRDSKKYEILQQTILPGRCFPHCEGDLKISGNKFAGGEKVLKRDGRCQDASARGKPIFAASATLWRMPVVPKLVPSLAGRNQLKGEVAKQHNLPRPKIASFHLIVIPAQLQKLPPTSRQHHDGNTCPPATDNLQGPRLTFCAFAP